MTAVGFLSGTFVRRSGDTMTGNLTINTDLQVADDVNVDGTLTAEYQGVDGDVVRMLSSGLSTGLTSGGLLSINGSGTTIDVSAASGWILDYNSQGALSPTNPKLTFVSYPGAIGVVLTGPLSQVITYWLVDSAGTLIQQATVPTHTQYRTHLVLGASIQFGGTLFGTQSLAMMQGQQGPQFLDLINSLGPFVMGDQTGIVSPNGANKMINISGGSMFIPSFGLPNYQDPHTGALAAQTPASFHYSTAVPSMTPLVNLIDVANYDPNGAGVITPIGGGAGNSTIHRVFGISRPLTTDQIIIQYGQTVYSSLDNAVNAIGSGSFILNPNFRGIPLLGWVVATRVATNLSDTTQARFVRAPRFAFP